MSTRQLRKKLKKPAINLAYNTVMKTKQDMKSKAHEFVCHGFISEVEYKKVIERINTYYKPLLNGFRKEMDK